MSVSEYRPVLAQLEPPGTPNADHGFEFVISDLVEVNFTAYWPDGLIREAILDVHARRFRTRTTRDLNEMTDLVPLIEVRGVLRERS